MRRFFLITAIALAATFAQAGPDEGWWRAFHDSALDGLEAQALAANQNLLQAVSRIDQARAEARIAAADFFPQLDFRPSASRMRTTDTGPKGKASFLGSNPFANLMGGEAGGGGAAGAGAGDSGELAFTSRQRSTTFNDLRVPIAMSWEVDVFGRIRHTYFAARNQAEASEADRDSVALSLSAQVASEYFGLRALDAAIAAQRRGVNVRQDAVKINQERVTGGVANALDLSRAKVELYTAQADLEELGRQRDEGENRLAELCGQAAQDFKVPARALEESRLPAAPRGIPSDLLERRPDVSAAERRLAAASETVSVARTRFLPTFNVQGSAGYESSLSQNLLDGDNRALSIMATMDLPIFEGGRNAAGLKRAGAQRDQALAAYRGAGITAFKEVANAMDDIHRRAAEYAARSSAVDAAQDVLKRSQDRYIEGAVNYFEVVDAERSLLGVDVSRAQTLGQRYAALVDLVRAIGGTWERGRPPEAGKR